MDTLSPLESNIVQRNSIQQFRHLYIKENRNKGVSERRIINSNGTINVKKAAKSNHFYQRLINDTFLTVIDLSWMKVVLLLVIAQRSENSDSCNSIFGVIFILEDEMPKFLHHREVRKGGNQSQKFLRKFDTSK